MALPPASAPGGTLQASEVRQEPLRILLISIHGLIRGRQLELGRDPDTGGQTKYVVELAKALARSPSVAGVDLVTRRIEDPAVSADYAEPLEPLADKARIVRIDAGPPDYLRKEELWDHLDSFADHLFAWIQNQPARPDVLHSHYADAGYVGVKLAHMTGLPLVHTGHSLGRDKYRRLISMGLALEKIEDDYNISRRIDAEEEVINQAALVITSTRNEIEDQYELYDCCNPGKMVVVPPGTDLQQFHVADGSEPVLDSGFQEGLQVSLKDPTKPMILALSRPDLRKNIITLLEAYGESKPLQRRANLVIVAGNRDDVRDLDEGPQAVFTELLIAMDSYDLYGLAALPKHHSSDEVPLIYRLAASTRGVFVNPALTEPFGLTLLEAAASGLPLVATENGGPVDIIANCRNGLLVDPLNKQAIAQALIAILEDANQWETFSRNGVRHVAQFYSWDAHAKAYLHQLNQLVQQQRPPLAASRILSGDRRRTKAIFTAIDNTLLGDRDGLNLLSQLIRERRKSCLFGIATGRRLDSVLAIIREYDIPVPDILITSLGTEIYYAPHWLPDLAWAKHINHLWTPQVLRATLKELPGLQPQSRKDQSQFKYSYHYDGNLAPSLDQVRAILRQQDLLVNVTLSFGQYLDFVPVRASKGQALRFIAQRWNIPLDRILATGGSGGDEDMLRGNTLGVVVANRHREELSILGDTEHVYLAEQSHARGILEALEHYDFFNL
ncbi:HAD-IIB family hydrolase [Synechococcus sp. CS-1328]|uniref:HAD-IIB family hydrolase n=1 Tax=Synechococcus sp. CS-1328 TaxID=2847976 RepID=UPI00223B7AD5|nr:HAD-IIB family hydrolase [Synechococcus sp. CS-1328]MCT0224338.1 HAD-IIB family hydrolase [Synechococcus sp. CS-1328]